MTAGPQAQPQGGQGQHGEDRCLTPGDELHVAGSEYLLCAASILRKQARLVYRFIRTSTLATPSGLWSVPVPTTSMSSMLIGVKHGVTIASSVSVLYSTQTPVGLNAPRIFTPVYSAPSNVSRRGAGNAAGAGGAMSSVQRVQVAGWAGVAVGVSVTVDGTPFHEKTRLGSVYIYLDRGGANQQGQGDSRR